MKNTILKSIGAIVAGMAVGAILSIATDKILETTGIMKVDPFDTNPVWLIIIVVIYRSIFNMAGCYVAAKLAPSNPMKHAIILGSIGTLVATLGAFAMWHIPPHWYPISLIILTMPAAWAGGKLAMQIQTSKKI